MAKSPFDLNLRHLRALLAIKEHGSITGAADIVFLSQPALTQGIAKLERQLGYTLFERQSDGMKVTPTGEMVADRVRAAVDHLNKGARITSRQMDQPARLMTMTQLRAFLALADAGTYGAAALATGLSQTAVHRAVSDFEQLLGKPLVERRGRGVSLNATGKQLLRGARLAVGEIAAIIAELGLDPSGEIVSLGSLPLSRPFLVPEALARMMTEQPNARFRITEGGWSDVVEPLRDGMIDFVVGALRPHEIEGLTQIPLFEDRLVIVAGRDHPLAGRAMPTLDVLSKYPWIVGPAGSPLRTQWEHLFAERDLPPSPIECGSVMIIGRLLTTSSDFLTLLSPDQVAIQIRGGLLARVGEPLANSVRLVGITTRRDWRPTATQRRFIELLKQVSEAKTASENPETARMADWI
jgi:LysR family transcriptional regulator, regulator for genes of the gallate degradation pathway